MKRYIAELRDGGKHVFNSYLECWNWLDRNETAGPVFTTIDCRRKTEVILRHIGHVPQDGDLLYVSQYHCDTHNYITTYGHAVCRAFEERFPQYLMRTQIYVMGERVWLETINKRSSRIETFRLHGVGVNLVKWTENPSPTYVLIETCTN